MSSEPPKDDTAPADESRPTASKDLTDGLHLMLSAAKKALKNVDPNRIEEVGRRAIKNIENLDTKKVGDLGKKAAKNLDPRKIEEVAEDAGRELLSVMERVAERIERIATGAIAGAKEGARGESKSSPPPAAETKADAADTEKSGDAGATPDSEAKTPESGDDKPRVRVDG
ncbi:MAG: hypothetical protein IPI67_13555 [Myxococcales bacterium]|nr:hypothetical protein [Myxococcales bacterium]